MRLRYGQLNDYTLDEWVEAFDQLYGETNRRLDRSPLCILAHMVEHESRMHEDFRTGKYHDALHHLADTFCWTCALATKCAALGYTSGPDVVADTYSFHVLWKFPYVCHNCAEDLCICPNRTALEKRATGIAKDFDTSARKTELETSNRDRLDMAHAQIEDLLTAPPPLGALELMFHSLYEHLNQNAPLPYVMAHFQEEIGEVAECLLNIEEQPSDPRWRANLRGELPDVLVWTVALVWTFDREMGATRKYQEMESDPSLPGRDRIRDEPLSYGLTLPGVLWTRYGRETKDDSEGLTCPRCNGGVCTC